MYIYTGGDCVADRQDLSERWGLSSKLFPCLKCLLQSSDRESVLLSMLHLVELFLHHGYVISFDTDKALTHSSCLQ